MEELVFLKRDEAVCSSLNVAEKFHKRHDNVLKQISNLLKNEGVKPLFAKGTYTDAKGEKRPIYYMNRDGFSLLVMGFTGKKALDWKLQYIKAFNNMENLIREKSTQAWIENRSTGKAIRLAETDAIKDFVEYAKENGSGHPQMYYKHFSDLANDSVGISSRELATTNQLNQLAFIENIILNQIRLGMEQKEHYKEIYKNCKKQIEVFKDIAFLNSLQMGGVACGK